MKTKTRICAALLALVMAVSLSACGGKETATTAGETQKSQVSSGAQGNESPAGTTAAQNPAASGETKKIGVIQLTEHPALDASYQGFIDALADLGYVDGQNIAVDFNNAGGETANCTTIADKLVNNESDLILAIATPAAQAVASKTSVIPIVGTAITDFAVAGLADSNEAPGGNVSGSSDLNPVAEQMSLLTQLLPDAKTVGILYCSSEDNSRLQADMAKAECEKLGLTWEEFTVSDSSTIQAVTESMIGKVDVVYIPTDNLLAEGMSTVSMVTNANNLPCIVGEEGMVQNGGLATYGLSYYNLGRLAGEMAAKVLEGAQISEQPVAYLAASDCTLCINTTAAAELGITIPEELLSQATIIE